jgi:hypothetical protein
MVIFLPITKYCKSHFCTIGGHSGTNDCVTPLHEEKKRITPLFVTHFTFTPFPRNLVCVMARRSVFVVVLVASMVCVCAGDAMDSMAAAPPWNSNRKKDGASATANLDFARLSRASTYAPVGSGSLQKARSPEATAASAMSSASASQYASPPGEEVRGHHHRTGLSRTHSVRDGLAEDVAQAVYDEQYCGLNFEQGCAGRFRDEAPRPALRASRRMDHEYRAGAAAATQTVAVKTNLYPYMFRNPAANGEQA